MIKKMQMDRSCLVLLSLVFVFYIAASTALSSPLPPVTKNQTMDYSKASLQQPEPTILSKPLPVSQYTKSTPATVKPMLTWTKIPGAVFYELEILSAPPENPNGLSASQYRVASSRQVYTNGYNPDLTAIAGERLFWRVRGLDLDGNPLGFYSDAAEIYINRQATPTIKPLPTADLNPNGRPAPLYPVYSWIPIAGAVKYEVEILDTPPENPNGIEPSLYRIGHGYAEGFDYYDQAPRAKPGTYYWRVRGLDAEEKSVGVFSDVQSFVVSREAGRYAATLGDSITHGGGAVSYSPADTEYDYQTYLHFPTVNLGHSGDTTTAMVERFNQDVLPFHPQFLIIMGGTNSIRGGTPAKDVINDLATLAELCWNNNIRPIFLTLPPINPNNIEKVFQEQTSSYWHENMAQVNDFIRRQPYFIDIAPALTGEDGLLPTQLAIDGLHFDIAGKQRMAEIINANWDRVTR